MNHDDENLDHSEEECEIMNIFDWSSEDVRFADNSCCYNCGLPGDMCEDYISRSCSRFNFVKGYVLIGVHGGSLDVLESIWKMTGQEFDISDRGLSELLR